MCVHQTECKYDHVVLKCNLVYPVHTGLEIIITVKQAIHGVPVSTEMPAIFNFYVSSLGKSEVEANIGFNLSQTVFTYSHSTYPSPQVADVSKRKGFLPEKQILKLFFCKGGNFANSCEAQVSHDGFVGFALALARVDGFDEFALTLARVG